MADFAEIQLLFDTALAEIRKSEEYYEHRQRLTKWGSGALRVLAIAAFFSGTLVPLLTPWVAEASKLTLLSGGYVLLATSAALIVVDQFLLGSESWRRYTVARVKLGFLNQTFAFEKSRFEITTDPNDASVADKLETTFARIMETRDAHHRIVEDETNAWDQGLSKAITDFKIQVEKSREGLRTEQQAEQARVDASKTAKIGTLEVAVTGAEQKNVTSMKVMVNGVTREIPEPFKGVVFSNVPAGPQSTHLTWQIDTQSFAHETAVDVFADKIAKATFNIA